MADGKEQTATVREVQLTAKPGFCPWYFDKYGFTIDGPRTKQFRLTDGRVCRPLWYVSGVKKDGPAEMEGIVPGDCILEIGDENVEGASLEYVYQCVDEDKLVLVLISDSHYQPSPHQQLYNAAVEGDLEAVNNALEGGADINIHIGLDEYIPLHLASQNGHLEVVTKLIDAGAKVNSKAKDEWIPLHLASQNGHLEVVTKLIDAGAKVNSKAKDERIPLHLASENGHLEVVTELIDAGAEVNSKAKSGRTPLDVAVHNNHFKIVNTLIDAGADLNSKVFHVEQGDGDFGSDSGSGSDSDSDSDPAPEDAMVPIEIMARGPDALAAYRKALKEGYTYDRRVPVMIVGQDRAGKTSLKKSLKGEKFDPNECSTVGIEVDPTLCHLTTKVWSVESPGVTIATEEKFEHLTAKFLGQMLIENQYHPVPHRGERHRDKSAAQKTKLTTSGGDKCTEVSESSDSAECIPEQRSNFPEPSSEENPTLPQRNPEKLSTSLESNPEPVRSIPEEIIQILAHAEETDMESDDDVELVLWDFAGHPVFYTTHVLFLSRIAIYILTYDLSKELCDKAVPLVKRDIYKRVLRDDKCETTNMDYIHYWLSSIHAFSSHSRTPSNESEHLPPKIPPVFLVGTHADKCSRPREVAMEVMFDLKGKSYEEHVVGKVFTVDNTRSGSQESEDEGIKKLRPEVLETARELRHMKELFPVGWLRLEKSLKSLKVDGASFTSLDIVRKKAQAVFDLEKENDFRTVINFLHDRHAVLHFSKPPELDRLVVLDHQWLIDVFKKVITVQPLECQARAFRKQWEDLENEGILSLELAKHVWKDLVPLTETVTSLLLMLEKFSLTCRWIQPDGSEVYLVPSMLMSEADSKILDLILSAEIPALIVRFANQYLPIGLFPRLVTRCVNWCSEEWSVRKQPKLCRNCARFFLGADGTYQVILAKGLNVISVSVIRGEKVAEMCDADRWAHKRSLATFCRAVLAFVKPALQEMQEEHLWMKLMSYTLCFTCPVCSKDGVRVGVCRLHRTTGCTRDQCLHYVIEDELVHDQKTLVCCESEDPTDTTISRKQFAPWFEALDGEVGPSPRIDDILCQTPTVPIEIRTRGHKALRAYQEALEEGETYDRRVPVMIVGQDRSGKTSLKKSLKGEIFNPDEGSTNGIDTCTLTKEVWKAGGSVESTDEKSFVERKFARVAARLTLKNLEEEQSHEKTRKGQPQKREIQVFTSPKLSADANAPSASKREESISEKVSTLAASVPRIHSKLPKSIPKKASALVGNRAARIPRKPEDVKKLHNRESENVESSSGRVAKVPKDVEDLLHGKSEDLETDSAPELILWDFAGQSVFYTTHSLFLSRKAIYILTYDLSRDLDAKAEPTVKINMYERKLQDSECGMTNMDYVHYWLSSIHAFSEDSDSRGGESKDLPPKLPAVFLVGTHADKCNKSKAVLNEIMENLKDKPYKDHVVRKLFTVDNTLSGKGEGDDEVKRLLEKLLKVAQQLPHMNEKIPLTWWLLEKDLKKFEDNDINFTSLDMVRKKARDVCNNDGEDHFRTVVNFFHDRHVVLHFDSTPQLDKLVVLGHQWLINIFKEVITVKPLECQESEFEKDWKALEEKGELHLELVEHVWEGKVPKGETITSLLQILQKFSLACEWVQPDGSKVHLVPSMLMSKADSKILKFISSAKVPAFVVRFPTEYVPFGLFPRLVTRCLKWFPAGQSKIFRNFACFFCDKSGCYQLIMASGLHRLSCVVIERELTIMSGAGCLTDKRGLTPVCREVYTFVKNQLGEMKKEHLWMKGMDYTFCFECPKCSKRGGDELHQDADRKLDQCLHYLTEDEIVDVKRPLVCDKSDPLPMEIISRELYIPWLETLESKVCVSQSSGAALPQSQTRSSSSEKPTLEPRKTHVVLLGQTWGWYGDGGLSQVTTEVSKQLAKNQGVRITCLVAELKEDQRDQAKENGVDLLQANPMGPCAPHRESYVLPDGVRDVDMVIGFGKTVRRHFQPIKMSCKCKWVHIACSSSEVNIVEELALCEESDVTFGLGSNVAEEFEGRLTYKEKEVPGFVPGIFQELGKHRQVPKEGKVFKVLAFFPSIHEGLADEEIYKVPAKAVGMLPVSKYKLIAVCAPGDKLDDVKTILCQQEITQKQLSLRHFPDLVTCCKLFVEADLLLLPFPSSTSEDFGLIALQAISAGLPVLVSSSTGLGLALEVVTHGSTFTVDSDNPEEWKERILSVKEKERYLRLEEAKQLHENYSEKFPWKGQCEAIVKKILS